MTDNPATGPEVPMVVMRSAVRQMTVADLVVGSDAVVLGTVVAPALGGSGVLPGTDMNVPYREIRIGVERYLTAPLGFDEVRVRMLGGLNAEIAFEAPEEPTFHLFERVLVFLCKDTGGVFDLPDESFTVQGLFQGKYSVVVHDDLELAVGNDGRVTRPLDDLLDEIDRTAGAAT